MLKRLTLDNFTVFEHAEFEFGMLNVIHGENGTGKTHVLKMAKFGLDLPRPRSKGEVDSNASALDFEVVNGQKVFLTRFIFDGQQRLKRLFAVSDMQILRRRKAELAEVAWSTDLGRASSITIRSGGTFGVSSEPTQASGELALGACFIPAQEVLSRTSQLQKLLEKYDIGEDETASVLRDFVAGPPIRTERISTGLQAIVDTVERDTGIRAELIADRFVISSPGIEHVPAQVAAMGHSKLAILGLLARRIEPGWALCWDEPEANLNPALLRVAAKAIVMLAQAGVQVFIATHSLFLMREIYLLNKLSTDQVDTRYFGLHRQDGAVAVLQGNDIAQTGAVVALEEELEQADKYMDVETGARTATTEANR